MRERETNSRHHSLFSHLELPSFRSQSRVSKLLKLAPQRRSQRHIGGQAAQQSSNLSSAPAMYDAGPIGDAGDAVMARWLQSAGLQHLASPSASGPDQRLMPNPLVQGYGLQTVEEKQKLYKLMRNLNFNGDFGLEPYETQGFSGGVLDDFYSPELRGELGAGLLDLHAMDDTELLSELVISEALETSPFMPVSGLDNDLDAMTSRQQILQTDANSRPSSIEKEFSTKESNVAKIKVVVRKRPLNKKELSRKEEDIVTVHDTACLTVHEPKLKVDLTAYVEKHEFYFDDVLNETVSNDEVYRVTVEPIIPTIFQRTKATCFAYGQTGSGKTFTMQPLPLRAAGDIVRLLHEPLYRNQRLKLWLSYFEIYGGKLFDLLSDRRKLCMREDGRQQVCIVGLQEFEVSDVQVVKEFIEKGNEARSTGSTGANEESSRSHAILQLVIKKQREVSESKRRNNDTKDTGKVVGKISFIDLAGSERGADTTDNDRQTRIEGAEINKSLLALKECIRALDNDQIHIPFRGSKLTEVLRDSFIGNSRTVMISCISPNEGSCEHTLNTLRYADRVKSLSKSGNSKKDQVPVTFPPGRESSPPSFPFQAEVGDPSEKAQDLKERGLDQKNAESTYYNPVLDRDSSRMITNFPPNGRDERVVASSLMEKEKNDGKRNYAASPMHRVYSAHDSSEDQDADKPSMVSPPRRKVFQEEKYEKQTNWSRKEIKQQNPSSSNFNSTISRHQEQGDACQDVDISMVLEEEDALIAAHRNEIEDTMEIVREEMKLLSEVDQPGSLIDDYVSQLGFLLSRKAAGLVSLQARLARFQHRLKEQEILSRKKGPR